MLAEKGRNFLMQGEKKKAKSLGSREKEEHRDPKKIDEYHFFLAQDDEVSEEAVPKEKVKKGK